MSKLSELQGKSKTYKIGNIEIDLRPLRLDDMKLVAINNDSTPEQQQEAAKALISKTLEISVPDSTEEERNNISFEYMEELMKAIMEINGLSDQKTGMKDVIKQRKQALANKTKDTTRA